MKIKTTKNIIKQVEGTNTFEVKTVGKRTDLGDLRNKLKVNGFTFTPSGELRDSYKRFNELIDHANKIEDVYKRDEAMEYIYTIQENLDSYTELYTWLNNKRYEYIYTLDMNNIEIITEEDTEGKTTAKAIINIVEDKDTDQLLFWEELLGDYNEEIFNNIKVKTRKYNQVMDKVLFIGDKMFLENNPVSCLCEYMNYGTGDSKKLVYTKCNETTLQIKEGMKFIFDNNKNIVYEVIDANKTMDNNELRLVMDKIK